MKNKENQYVKKQIVKTGLVKIYREYYNSFPKDDSDVPYHIKESVNTYFGVPLEKMKCTNKFSDLINIVLENQV